MYIINALWTQRQKLLLTTFKKCDDIESSALTYVEFTKAPPYLDPSFSYDKLPRNFSMDL